MLIRDKFTTEAEILDGFDISVRILDYNRNLGKNIFDTVKTTWVVFDDLEYDVQNEYVKSLVFSVLNKNLSPSIAELSAIQLLVKGMTRIGMAQITRQRSAMFNTTSQETQLPEKTKFVRLRNIKNIGAFEKLIQASVDLYNELVKDGVPPQDARYVLPQCSECANIVWNTSVSQIKNISLLRLCNTSAAAEINLVIRTYLKEFSILLKQDFAAGKIDKITFDVYQSLLKTTDCLGSNDKTFRSFPALMGDSNRFKKKADVPLSLKPLYDNLKFNSLDFKKSFFYAEMKTGKYLILDGEEDVF